MNPSRHPRCVNHLRLQVPSGGSPGWRVSGPVPKALEGCHPPESQDGVHELWVPRLPLRTKHHPWLVTPGWKNYDDVGCGQKNQSLGPTGFSLLFDQWVCHACLENSGLMLHNLLQKYPQLQLQCPSDGMHSPWTDPPFSHQSETGHLLAQRSQRIPG